MSVAVPIEFARHARERTAAGRVHRDSVLRSARAARREARRLRARSVNQREAALEQRWAYWAAGSIPSPPSYVPASWESRPDDPATLVVAAAAQCRSTAATILRLATGATGALPLGVSSRIPAVIALCEVAANQLEDGAAGGRTLLGACARACDTLEAEIESAWPDDLGVALSATCRASARAIRRALVRLREQDELL
jgi:hypothetical protein